MLCRVSDDGSLLHVLRFPFERNDKEAYDRSAGKAEIAELGLPSPGLLLTLTVVCQVICGLMVLLGFWTRLGAFVLRGFTVVATLLAHVSQSANNRAHGTDGADGSRSLQSHPLASAARNAR